MNPSFGTWSSVSIVGKQADIFVPSGNVQSDRAVIYLHGHGLATLNEKPAFTAELAKHGLRCICPHGQRSWWLPRTCTEFDTELTSFDFVRQNVMEWIQQNWQIECPMVALMGVSMGGQGALQLSYRHAREFPVVAGIAAAVDFQQWVGQGLPLDEMFSSREAARQQTATLHLHPLNWPRHQLLVCDPADWEWIEGNERLASKLQSMGVPFEADFTTTKGGHVWEYFDSMAPRVMDFIAQALDQESRRLPTTRD
jgi:S-formylglutathione hydrolase FrmB